MIVTHLLTNERVLRDLPFVPTGIRASDNREVLVTGPAEAVVFKDPVPIDLDELPGWIDRATNARVVTKTDQLRWIEP